MEIFENRCIVCKYDLPLNMTQLAILINDKLVSACMSHEGTEELEAAIKKLKGK